MTFIYGKTSTLEVFCDCYMRPKYTKCENIAWNFASDLQGDYFNFGNLICEYLERVLPKRHFFVISICCESKLSQLHLDLWQINILPWILFSKFLRRNSAKTTFYRINFTFKSKFVKFCPICFHFSHLLCLIVTD